MCIANTEQLFVVALTNGAKYMYKNMHTSCVVA